MRVLLDGSALEGRGHRLTCQGRSRGHGLTPVLRVCLVERRLLDVALKHALRRVGAERAELMLGGSLDLADNGDKE